MTYLLLTPVILVVYLCKQDRHDAILSAAADIALHEGLAATTVRRVSTAAHTAVGQVHHHFSSASALRAEAYKLVMKNLQQELVASSCHLSALERLQLYLIDPQHEKYLEAIRLWREAMILTEQDELMRTAFASSLSDWHGLVKEVIEAGKTAEEFILEDSTDDIAWRLIGLSSSMDGMSRLASLGLTPERVAYNLNRAIDIELRLSTSSQPRECMT